MTDPQADLGFPTRGVLLGIDHGIKRIGVALCDGARIITRPLLVIERTTREAEFALLQGLIKKHQAVGIVVGLPLDVREATAGSFTPESRTVQRWVSRLKAVVSIPVILWDERFSSFEAESRAEVMGRDPNEPIDHWSAAVILEDYLQAHHPAADPPTEPEPD